MLTQNDINKIIFVQRKLSKKFDAIKNLYINVTPKSDLQSVMPLDSRYLVITNCESQFNKYNKALINTTCPLFMFKNYKLFNNLKSNTKYTYQNACGAKITYYLDDNNSQIEDKINNKKLILDPCLDCYFNQCDTFKEEFN